MTFTLCGKTYTKLPFPGERSVELPVAWEQVQEGGRVLEVGNCLHGTYGGTHLVLDLTEKAPHVLNEDIEFHQPERPYDRIVSVSTFEHIGYGDYGQAPDPEKLRRCLKHCEEILAPDGQLFLTWPWGFNYSIDEAIWVGRIKAVWSVMLRVQNDLWVEADKELLRTVKYNQPFRFANALIFAWLTKTSGGTFID